MNKNKTINQFFQGTIKKSSVGKEQFEEEKQEVKGTVSYNPNVNDGKTIPEFDDFIQGLGSWQTLLKDFTGGQKMKGIHQYIKKEYAQNTCYPTPHQIFNAFNQTPLSQLKVVIVGQDPYINVNEAMGLCFSVPRGTKVPPSLMNIYKNLQLTVPTFIAPKHGDLTHWANQGVFLLNTVLTVEAKKSNSHKDCGWTQFTDEVIKVIDQECDGLVFLLWGKPAQLKAKKVNRKKRHHVFETSHPSPLSAHAGFLASNHFMECNETLKKLGKDEIDWNLIQ